MPAEPVRLEATRLDHDVCLEDQLGQIEASEPMGVAPADAGPPVFAFLIQDDDPEAQLLGEGEETLIARCDPALIETVRRNWPFLRDRRVDAYGPILNRYIGQ